MSQKLVIKHADANTKRKTYKYTGDEASKIITRYIKIVQIAVLSGQEWKFPNNFGTLRVVCRNNSGKRINEYSYRKKGYRRKSQLDLKRYPYVYEFQFESPFLKEQKFEFKAASSFRQLLKKILLQTDIEFTEI